MLGLDLGGINAKTERVRDWATLIFILRLSIPPWFPERRMRWPNEKQTFALQWRCLLACFWSHVFFSHLFILPSSYYFISLDFGACWELFSLIGQFVKRSEPFFFFTGNPYWSPVISIATHMFCHSVSISGSLLISCQISTWLDGWLGFDELRNSQWEIFLTLPTGGWEACGSAVKILGLSVGKPAVQSSRPKFRMMG